MVTLKLKGSCTVKPATKTPTGLMYLPEFDQFLATTHATQVYFYQLPSTHNHELSIKAILEILKQSLSEALAIFYPLAGRLKPIARGRFEINCNSTGALFLEAESDFKIDDFGDFCPTLEMRSLVPSVDYNTPIHEQPLLLIQLTKFSCGGISLGIGISHLLVDGRSGGNFISEWARIARGEQQQNLPFLDRTLLQTPTTTNDLTPRHLQEFSPPPLLIGHFDSSTERKKKTVVTMLKLSKDRIQNLKNKANDSNTSSGRAFTRFEAVAAHVWRCACKARSHKTEQITSLRVSMDVRSRFKPPISKWYFGSVVLAVVPIATAGDIVFRPLGYAAGKVREAIEKVTDEYLKSCLVYLGKEPDLSRFRYHHTVGSSEGPFYGNPNLSITDWTRLPLFGVDFGWGKEIYMVPGGVGFDGKGFVLPGRDEEGSLVIAFRLQVEHMENFKKFFYGDISGHSTIPSSL